MSYAELNGQWPDDVPPLTGPEAISAAKRLYRFAMGKSFKGKWKVTSGRRFTWPRSGTFYVNPERGPGLDGGWRDLVHMLSHLCHQRLHPGWKAHGAEHHFLERRMVDHVLAKGWLDGRLKPRPKIAPNRADQLAAAAARWEKKRRRAETALRKLTRQRAALARREAMVK